MTVAGLLTGKGNNTLKDKNILNVLEKPVLYYPATAGLSSSKIDYKYVSSNDDKILDIAESLGYKRIKRPEELSLPNSQHVDAIYHALDYMENDGISPDIIVVILANNITINSRWIDDCIDIMLKDMSISTVTPVYQDNDHHPYRSKKLNKDGYLEMFVPVETSNISTNRQDLEKSYFLCHNFWVLNVQKLLSQNGGQPPWYFMGDKVVPYHVEMSIDIHTEFDLRIAAEWLSINEEKWKI